MSVTTTAICLYVLGMFSSGSVFMVYVYILKSKIDSIQLIKINNINYDWDQPLITSIYTV